ncbi:hypothetical protein QTP88_012519 [Uroleucon formosanum]
MSSKNPLLIRFTPRFFPLHCSAYETVLNPLSKSVIKVIYLYIYYTCIDVTASLLFRAYNLTSFIRSCIISTSACAEGSRFSSVFRHSLKFDC